MFQKMQKLTPFFFLYTEILPQAIYGDILFLKQIMNP